ncbi:hypothetical protein POSPLADRAFT_1084323, partial [Postia placenta MAD-698-R-SB12]
SIAMEQMGEESAKAPAGGVTFRSARRLKNGGVIFEMNSIEAATWLREPDVMPRFLSFYDGGNSVAKSNKYPIIIEFVSTDFDPTSEHEVRKIETDAALPTHAIQATRWLKPINRRRPFQAVAHLFMSFGSPDDANMVIRDGLIVEGKRVYARKLLPEPRRCLRCHMIGSNHLAAECPNERDTCGTCGKEHRTADCMVQSREDRFCVNCEMAGHGAWDRACPTFRAKYANFARNRPEDEYRYYPTSDPRTW